VILIYARARIAIAPAMAYAMGPLVAAALVPIWMGAEDVEETGMGVEVVTVVAGSVVVGGGGVKVLRTV